MKTKLDGTDIAFVKYKLTKPGISPIYGCYSFRERNGRWLYSGDKGRKYLCITLAYLKNDVLENLFSGFDDGEEFQRELNQNILIREGVDLMRLVEVVGDIVAKRKSNPTYFNYCCHNIK